MTYEAPTTAPAVANRTPDLSSLQSKLCFLTNSSPDSGGGDDSAAAAAAAPAAAASECDWWRRRDPAAGRAGVRQRSIFWVWGLDLSKRRARVEGGMARVGGP